MDVLDVLLLAVVYTAVIAAVAVATPRVGNFVCIALRETAAGLTTPAE